MFPPELDFMTTSDEPNWIIKLKVGSARGVYCRDGQDPKQPASFFCALSLLLQGTDIEDRNYDHEVCPLAEAQIDHPNSIFKVELQRSTELKTALVDGENIPDGIRRSAQSSADNTDDDDFQLFGPGMPQMNPSPARKDVNKIEKGPSRGLTVHWGEEFCLGVSHPDICPDEDSREGKSDHLELRPRLSGEPLKLLITLHFIDSSGCVGNIGQVLNFYLLKPCQHLFTHLVSK